MNCKRKFRTFQIIYPKNAKFPLIFRMYSYLLLLLLLIRFGVYKLMIKFSQNSPRELVEGELRKVSTIVG